MGYSAGAFSGSDGFDVVMTKLHDFAVAEGWTSHYNTYPYLHVSINDVFVNLFFQTTDTVNDSQNTGNPVADYRIYGHLSTAFTSNGTPAVQFLNQTGSLVNASSLANTAFVKSNDWVGPYSNYWLFSGAVGEAKYIHLVVQKANGRFCMLSFGSLDKKGATYTGGAFLHGIFWHWWFDGTVGIPNITTSAQGSDFQSQGHKWLGDGVGNYNIWVGAAQDAAFPMIAHDFSTGGHAYEGLLALMSRQSNVGVGATLESLSDNQVAWLHPIFFLGPNPVNGVTPLFEIPVMKFVSADSRAYYLGAIPGMQWCSMTNRLETEDLSFGSDDWIVFPFKRALPWNPEPYSTKTITSGPYGYACKKNT